VQCVRPGRASRRRPLPRLASGGRGRRGCRRCRGCEPQQRQAGQRRGHDGAGEGAARWPGGVRAVQGWEMEEERTRKRGWRAFDRAPGAAKKEQRGAPAAAPARLPGAAAGAAAACLADAVAPRRACPPRARKRLPRRAWPAVAPRACMRRGPICRWLALSPSSDLIWADMRGDLEPIRHSWLRVLARLCHTVEVPWPANAVACCPPCHPRSLSSQACGVGGRSLARRFTPSASAIHLGHTRRAMGCSVTLKADHLRRLRRRRSIVVPRSLPPSHHTSTEHVHRSNAVAAAMTRA
jgi:hypothetical protein